MTTDPNTAPVTEIKTSKHLKPEEQMSLLLAVNGVRAGLWAFYVAFEYDKQTKAPPRVAGKDFMPIPTASGKLHMGWVVKAPTNKQGKVYLLIADVARADGQKHFGWTAVRPEGLKNIQIRGFRPWLPMTAAPAAQNPQPAS